MRILEPMEPTGKGEEFLSVVDLLGKMFADAGLTHIVSFHSRQENAIRYRVIW